MGTLLSALLRLQSVESRVVTVKSRLRSKQGAVAAQQKRIDQAQDEWDSLHEQSINRRKQADSLDLDLKERDQKVASLRSALNTAKTNKEYAALLTQINTLKADNAKLEDDGLKVMQDVEAIAAETEQVKATIEAEKKRGEEISQSSQAEVDKLSAMMEKLSAERAEAAKEVPAKELALFERISQQADGEAMATVEIHGDKPPHDYICGGCYMGLNAEHVNALLTRDAIRTCDSCGRILYLQEQATQTPRNS